MTEVQWINANNLLVRLEGEQEEVDEAMRSIETDMPFTEWLDVAREHCDVEVHP